jgi:hypothetical protein
MISRVARETQGFLKLAHDFPYRISETLEKLSRDDLRIQLEHKNLAWWVLVDRAEGGTPRRVSGF